MQSACLAIVHIKGCDLIDALDVKGFFNGMKKTQQKHKWLPAYVLARSLTRY